MSENPRRRRQARNFKTNVPKILDLKSSSEQIFFQKLLLGAPDACPEASVEVEIALETGSILGRTALWDRSGRRILTLGALD